MTNKPNTDKTIEQIRDDAAQVYCDTDTQRVYRNGFDSALKICEQRERDLISACNELKYQLMRQHGSEQKIFISPVYGDIYFSIFLALKHRGENDSKD